jgi:hypothetical protein
MTKRQIGVLLAAILLVCSAAYAQETRATISGTVLDASNAAVPGAAVTVTEVRTGVKATTVSDSSGRYNVPFLAPGEYEVFVESAGFRQFLRRGLQLATGDHPILDFKLEVGQATAEVTVREEAPLVDAANSTTGQSITAKQVEDMPLNGRNPMMVAQLAIGVIATGQPSLVHPFDNAAASAWSIGGSPSQTAEILMDGAPNATWDNRMAYAPPQDAVQEVKVKAFDADASYGHTGSGTINKVMKTGTNDLHGSAYWFGQPPSLAANNLFNNSVGIPVQQTKLDQYGGTAGGPVVVPKAFNGRNKLFWFFGLERLGDSQPNSKFLTVPTTVERNGDFSSLLSVAGASDCVTGANGATKTGFNCYQIFNPYSGALSGSTVTRLPFYCDAAGNAITPTLTAGANFGKQASGTPCNKLPQQLLSPVALNYQNFYPMPNTAGSATGYGNYGNSTTTDDHYSNQLGRLDWAMSQRSRLSGNVRHNNELQSKDNFFGNHSTGTFLNRENWGATLDEVFTLNSSTVLDIRANYTKMNEGHPTPLSGFDPAPLGFPSYIAANSTYRQVPAISFGSSCGNTTTQASSFDCFGNTTSDFIPSSSYQLFGDAVKQWGSHTLKFGADARKYILNAHQYGAATGSYTFTSTATTSWTTGPVSNLNVANFGQDFASFLLGLPTTGQYDINGSGSFSSKYYAVFLQDDWRVRSSLTVNLGIRYDHDTPYSEQNGRTVNGFDLTDPNPVAAAAIAAYSSSTIPQLPASSFKVPGGLTFASAGNGAIWQNRSHVVSPRVGFAWSPTQLHGNTVVRGGFAVFVQPLAMASLNPIGTYSSTPTLTQQGFSQTTPFVVPSNFQVPSTTLSDPFPGASFLEPAGSSAGLATFNGQNLTFFAPQQRDPYSERWTFGIQHSLGSDLLLEVAYIGNHAVHLPIAFTQINAVPQQYLSTLPYRDQTVITNLTASVTNPFKNLLPGTSLNSATTTTRQLLAPFPQFPVVDSTAFSTGVTERNATIGRSYFNSLNVRVEKRLSHGVSVIGSYAWSKLTEADSWLNANDPIAEKRISPFDHTQHLVTAVNYMLPIGRGRMLNLQSRLADALIGGWQVNGIFTYQTGAPILWMNGSTNNPGDYPICAVAVVKGSCPLGSNGLPQAAAAFPSGISYDSRQVNQPAFDITHFVTASASQYQFHVRTIPTTFGQYRQDSINNFDASVIKNFAIAEAKTVQFRVEAFNVLNHPTFGAPNTQLTSSTFGTINTMANRPRQVQLGARFIF